ncbi:hypothetical protein Tco_0931566 [Tanacetum coccineum]
MATHSCVSADRRHKTHRDEWALVRGLNNRHSGLDKLVGQEHGLGRLFAQQRPTSGDKTLDLLAFVLDWVWNVRRGGSCGVAVEVIAVLICNGIGERRFYYIGWRYGGVFRRLGVGKEILGVGVVSQGGDRREILGVVEEEGARTRRLVGDEIIGGDRSSDRRFRRLGDIYGVIRRGEERRSWRSSEIGDVGVRTEEWKYKGREDV